jgi:hypothetical protein
MTDEWWIGENLEGSSNDLIEVYLRKFPWGTEENHKIFSQIPEFRHFWAKV